MREKYNARGPWVIYRPGDQTYWKRGLWVPDAAQAERMAKSYALTIERQLADHGLVVYATKHPQDARAGCYVRHAVDAKGTARLRLSDGLVGSGQG